MRQATTQHARARPLALGVAPRGGARKGARPASGTATEAAPTPAARLAILRVNIARDKGGIHVGDVTSARLSQERPDVVVVDARSVRPAAVYRSIARIRSVGWIGGIVLMIEPADLPVVPVGSSLGATDFVLSTASAEEVDARVRREATRHRGAPGKQRNGDDATGIQLHWRTHEISLGETRIGLTLREMQMLDVLMQGAGEVVTAADLAGRAWGKPRNAGGGLATTYVCSLRKKLAWFGGRFGIRTVRGVGYRFVA